MKALSHSRVFGLVFIVAVIAWPLFKGLTTHASDSDKEYFPRGTFDADDTESGKKDGEHSLRLYTKYLNNMSEPSLRKSSMDEKAPDVYRLLWIPPFRPPVSVRVTRRANSVVIDVVTLEFQGGKTTGKVSIAREVKGTQEQWEFIEAYASASDFWTMDTSKNEDRADGVDLDRDILLCEGSRKGKYHVVHRKSIAPRFDWLCWYIMSLSGLDLKEAWIDSHGEDAIRKTMP